MASWSPNPPGKEMKSASTHLMSYAGLTRVSIIFEGWIAWSRPAMTDLVPVMIRLERAFRFHADIVCLVLAKFGQLDADLGQMQPRDLLVQRLRQHVDLLLVFAGLVVGPQFDLRQR